MRLINRLLNTLGIDGAILYTSSARIIQAGGSIITLLLIAKFLSKEEQGFYYTFTSVLAIQIFFELGLSGILTQFVAHEMAHIKLENNIFKGEQKYISRLASIIHFSAKWYFIFALLLIIALILGGGIFFYKNTQGVEHIQWQVPWLMVSIFGGLNLLISPIMAILQGMHKVKEIAKLSFIQQIIVMIVSWISLILGAKLYLVAINLMMNFFILLILYGLSGYLKLLYNLLKYKVIEKINYWKEIFPYQWKIALSWASGYFIFQALNPIVFSFYGAVVAGKLGMTITILNGILALVISWTSTKIPLWSSYIAKREYDELDKSVIYTIKKSTLVAFLGISGAIILIGGLQYFNLNLGNRFLPIELAFILLMTIPINNVINIWSASLRSFKKEPFLFVALMVGLFSITEVYITAKFFSLTILIVGYFLVFALVSLPLNLYVYNKKKKEYYE
ncbi:oligosaccharide flippase family protein [Capnocytophaga leadbetteri]|uniref:oligosaccharide flippase family protein n=1 Tax=Capnocytophaga leadbetteri TaxID=327575 RepID=UPI0026EDFC7F|nr:oligosaccharide flippase family protein [Capnocytophaga leadbetteri]